MLLTEGHKIYKTNSMYTECDYTSYKSKNVYNSDLYFLRQRFFATGLYTSYASVNWLFSRDDQFDYRQLPAKVAQQTMKMVDQNFRSYFKAHRDWKEHPEKYKAEPKLPKYLHSEKGRYVTVWTKQAISKRQYDRTGYLCLSGTDIKIRSNVSWEALQQVRLVPRTGHYVIEVVYEVPDVRLLDPNGIVAACDFGVDNLMTLTFNVPGVAPIIIDGKKLKSINQYFNKEISKEQEKLAKKHKDKKTSDRIQQLYNKRENSINDYLHKASRKTVNQLASLNVTEFIMGHTNDWKQDINLGDESNQKFMYIPFNKLIHMLTYKCERAGIRTILQEESYTSKASFLDMDGIPVYKEVKDGEEKPVYRFSGYRKHRGLYKRKGLKGDSAYINADVNGSYNIMRKGKPTAFQANGVVGVVVRPVRYCICETKSRKRKSQLH